MKVKAKVKVRGCSVPIIFVLIGLSVIGRYD